MKERPILFSAPMVRAILAGRKTQTRRAVKGSPGRVTWSPIVLNGYGGWCDEHGRPAPCPYGKPGDRLWVRETWQHSNFPLGPYDESCSVFYRADYMDDPHGPDGEKSPEGKYRTWVPSIHMFRSASRILLEVTDVRVERLQDISDRGPQNDCTAEGVFHCGMDVPRYEEWGASGFRSSEKYMYRQLWESINSAGSWDANPWVWVVEFRRADEPLNARNNRLPEGSPVD